MADTTNDIDALLAYMETVPRPDLRANLTALVAERDGLRKRVAELEALSKPVYISHGQRVESIDLRERLVCAALTGLNSNSDLTERDSDLPQWAINQADQVLAAMRKGEA
jgi:hypothetical protein